MRVPQSQTACHLAPADHSDRSISGRRLSRLTKDASAKDRALADALEQGALRILDPTRTQAAALTKSSPSYVATVARLSEAERTQLARCQLSLEPLMQLLETLNMQSGKELVSFIRAQDWHDAQTKLVILHEINTAITKLRTSNGKPPIDDGLWGEPATVFQTVRLIVVPIESKSTESCSAN